MKNLINVAFNFLFFKDTDEKRLIHSNSDNRQIMMKS